MRGEYIRRHDGGLPTKGFTVVQFPATETETAATYEVYEPLATEMRTLISKGRVKEARTLLFWFDDTGLTNAS